MVNRPVRLPGLPAQDRCLVMGVVNVTPDSFSDGGKWFCADDAIAHGLELAAQGADIVDVGGESTRPGALRITEEEELRRVSPVVQALVQSGLVVSIDTMRPAVAEFALSAGARMVNDVSGGPGRSAHARPDRQRPGAVSWSCTGATSAPTCTGRAVYDDVVAEVTAELAANVTALVEAGIDPGLLILDPGLGFAKQPAHNWAILTRLDEISQLACPGPPFPVLVGASRKGFISRLLSADPDNPRPFDQNDDATIALTALAAVAGAWCVRVHAVPGNARRGQDRRPLAAGAQSLNGAARRTIDPPDVTASEYPEIRINRTKLGSNQGQRRPGQG